MKSVHLPLALLLLTACTGQPTVSSTQTPLLSPTIIPTATTAPRPEPTATKSVFLDVYAWNDAFGDGYIARLPFQELKNEPKKEIARRLVEKWLDHYTTDCTDPLYRLQTYSVGDIQLDTASLGYEIIAMVQYSILPVQPLTADYKGEVAPNGYVSLPGEIAQDGTLSTGGRFGIFRDGQDYRLRILIGWGT